MDGRNMGVTKLNVGRRTRWTEFKVVLAARAPGYGSQYEGTVQYMKRFLSLPSSHINNQDGYVSFLQSKVSSMKLILYIGYPDPPTTIKITSNQQPSSGPEDHTS